MFRLSISVFLVFLFSVQVYAFDPSELIKLSPVYEPGLTYFALDVALYENTAVVGSRHSNSKRGAAYVYELQNGSWNRVEILEPFNNIEEEWFGSTVDVHKDTIVVGAINNKGSDGTVYVFRKINNQWGFEAQLKPNDTDYFHYFGSSAHFGTSVSIYNDTIVAGAPNRNGGGAAYIFNKVNNQWIQTQKISGNDIVHYEFFGSDVKVVDDTVMVGNIYDSAIDSNGNKLSSAGSVYVFEIINGVWQQIQKLEAEMPLYRNHFGQSMDFKGDRAIIGTHPHDNSYSGNAYFFKKENGIWVQKQWIKAPDAVNFDLFGFDISIFGEKVLIGAYNNINLNSAYLFDYVNDEWVFSEKFYADTYPDMFGYSLGLHSGKALIGAPGTNGGGTAYIYTFNNSPAVNLPISDVAVLQDSLNTTIDLSQHFTDVDDDVLTYTVDNTNTSLVNSSVSGSILILQYQPNQSGSASITVTATDPDGFSVSDTFTVTVLPAGGYSDEETQQILDSILRNQSLINSGTQTIIDILGAQIAAIQCPDIDLTPVNIALDGTANLIHAATENLLGAISMNKDEILAASSALGSQIITLQSQLNDSTSLIQDSIASIQLPAFPIDDLLREINENQQKINEATAHIDLRADTIENLIDTSKNTLSNQISTTSTSILDAIEMNSFLVQSASTTILERIQGIEFPEDSLDPILSAIYGNLDSINDTTAFLNGRLIDVETQMSINMDLLSDQISTAQSSILGAVNGNEDLIRSVSDSLAGRIDMIKASLSTALSQIDENEVLIQSTYDSLTSQISIQAALIQSVSALIDAQCQALGIDLETMKQEVLADLQGKVDLLQTEINENQGIIANLHIEIDEIQTMLAEMENNQALDSALMIATYENVNDLLQIVGTFNERDIEDHLANNDVVVRLYVPVASGGELENVAALVLDRINLVESLNTSSRNARTLYNSGINKMNSGDYYGAFSDFASAYSELIKVPKK